MSFEMKFLILIYTVISVHLFIYCGADLYKYGTKIASASRRIYHRTLIDDCNKVAKDYTLIYKYFGAKYKEVAYMQIDVNVDSTGYLRESNQRKDFDAKIQINNALNVTATIEIYAFGIIELPSFGRWLKDDYDTKSLTFVYKKNSNKSLKTKPFAQNAIGRRRNGDKLVYFESRNVTNASRFPSRAFEYSGNAYITYVGFSFNSPTAMVMINTSYVFEQEFNAVAYDMNTEHFVANMSVYGIESVFRPSNFEGVI